MNKTVLERGIVRQTRLTDHENHALVNSKSKGATEHARVILWAIMCNYKNEYLIILDIMLEPEPDIIIAAIMTYTIEDKEHGVVIKAQTIM